MTTPGWWNSYLKILLVIVSGAALMSAELNEILLWSIITHSIYVPCITVHESPVQKSLCHRWVMVTEQHASHCLTSQFQYSVSSLRGNSWEILDAVGLKWDEHLVGDKWIDTIRLFHT